ncbi:MAG TPA: hypothetical protein VL727_17885 [Puia sp.]|nr:hypothetical protein [Puia sp.]
MKDKIKGHREEEIQFDSIKVDPTMKDHSNDPYVIKKTEAAKRTLDKVKFPPNWRNRK